LQGRARLWPCRITVADPGRFDLGQPHNLATIQGQTVAVLDTGYPATLTSLEHPIGASDTPSSQSPAKRAQSSASDHKPSIDPVHTRLPCRVFRR
jgi:hypothetical protein